MPSSNSFELKFGDAIKKLLAARMRHEALSASNADFDSTNC